MTVNPDGIPESLHVVSCSDDVFAANSLAAAGKYRFQPALDRSGSPVSTSLKVEVDFQLTKTNEVRADQEPDVLKCEIVAPPGVSSQTPDSYGVYPLSKAIVAPAIARFVDRGFIAKAHLSPNLVACDIFLTIDKKGRAADPKVAHCDEQILEAPAADSLLKSRFRPGLLNGEAVPVRILFHLVYTGSAPKL
jgi:hypothetical protein